MAELRNSSILMDNQISYQKASYTDKKSKWEKNSEKQPNQEKACSGNQLDLRALAENDSKMLPEHLSVWHEQDLH